jgi:hypothetical protein
VANDSAGESEHPKGEYTGRPGTIAGQSIKNADHADLNGNAADEKLAWLGTTQGCLSAAIALDLCASAFPFIRTPRVAGAASIRVGPATGTRFRRSSPKKISGATPPCLA